MRQWRVGTFSMGTLLIALGLILLAAQVMGLSVINHIIIWWPVILIILGLEVLIYLYKSNQDDSKVKYDIFSIFLIFAIMMFSMAAHLATGIMQGTIPVQFH